MPGLEHVTNVGLRVEQFKKNFFKYYLANFPTLFHICYDPIGTHKKSRACFGFLLGFSFGVFLYEGIIIDLQFDAYTSVTLGGIVIVMLSVACASSIQVNIKLHLYEFGKKRKFTILYNNSFKIDVAKKWYASVWPSFTWWFSKSLFINYDRNRRVIFHSETWLMYCTLCHRYEMTTNSLAHYSDSKLNIIDYSLHSLFINKCTSCIFILYDVNSFRKYRTMRIVLIYHL